MTHFTSIIDLTDINEEWDRYVIESEMGNFFQTSLWAKAKKSQEWKALRVILKNPDGAICGGGQVFYKKLFGLLYLIQLQKGPIYDPNDQASAIEILEEIKHHFRKFPFVFVAQPENSCWDLRKELLKNGYGTSFGIDLEESSTIIIDVSGNQEEILKQIKPRKRNLFRKTENLGLTFIESTDRQELDTFYLLHKRIADHREFDIQNRGFFDIVWDQFMPLGWMHLFMEKYEGQTICSMVVFTFRDTLHIYRIGWKDGFNTLYPNEGMYWFLLKWAHEHNYHWVDFGGIDKEVADAVLNRTAVPEWAGHTYNGFKLHISENIVSYPGTVEYFHPQLFSSIIQLLVNHPALNRLLKNIYRLFRHG
ncbi:MAG: peptidoglycan bridge formation glycyltransferase FemA/FemB family protein [Leptolinea sp.]|jgi:lipid II:glycine glycyltransferase (peptidoglycan interpeptide bridge formation enzyme)|nr:peptidoglycan bridge formation glycyltransferase FemA/FemB family protein [Leptolinea sp.]